MKLYQNTRAHDFAQNPSTFSIASAQWICYVFFFLKYSISNYWLIDFQSIQLSFVLFQINIVSIHILDIWFTTVEDKKMKKFIEHAIY